MNDKTSPLVQMKEITKSFPGVVANYRVDFEVKRGEIHCLLGENGAGKSTLMNILYGLYTPDEGEIYLRGERAFITSPMDAIRLGIGMVHQHFRLVPNLTATENVILGLRSPKEPLLDLRVAEQKIAAMSERYGLKANPRAKIRELSVGEQQRIEILKALYREVDILILDEPTSVLTPQETGDLFQFLRSMTKEGRSVIFITHKLNEVMAVSGRVTVLKNGRVVSTVETSQTSTNDLARLMIGREVLFRLSKPDVTPGANVLEVRGLWAFGDTGAHALRGIDLDVARGEILGIAGVAGNGQKELIEVITGLRKPTRGKIIVDGKDVTGRSVRDIRECGVSHITEDRIGRGLLMDRSVQENAILGMQHSARMASRFLLRFDEVAKYTDQLIAAYDIKTPSRMTPARHLSGGNLQKLVLARELSSHPKIVVAASPTKGLDVGATEFIRRELLEQRKEGVAVVLISEDLDEIFDLGDRIAVMYEGRVTGLLRSSEATYDEVGLLMTGVKGESEQQEMR